MSDALSDVYFFVRVADRLTDSLPVKEDDENVPGDICAPIILAGIFVRTDFAKKF